MREGRLQWCAFLLQTKLLKLTSDDDGELCPRGGIDAEQRPSLISLDRLWLTRDPFARTLPDAMRWLPFLRRYRHPPSLIFIRKFALAAAAAADVPLFDPLRSFGKRLTWDKAGGAC